MNTTDYHSWPVQKAILLEYLQVMIANEDWHGVADVAMDLRELQAHNQSETRNDQAR